MSDVSLSLWLDSKTAADTSVAALRKITDNGQRESLKELIYQVLVEHNDGLTYDELWKIINQVRPGTKEGTVRPRIVELRQENRVTSDVILRHNTASGIPHLVWKIKQNTGEQTCMTQQN